MLFPLEMQHNNFSLLAVGGAVPIGTNVILSHHDYASTPSDEQLDALVTKMFQSGADIAKVASTATNITDAMRMLALPGRAQGSLPIHLLLP